MAQAAKAVSQSKSPTRLLACVADEVTREAVNRAASQLGWTDAVVRAGGLAAAAKAFDPAKAPALLLVDLADDADATALADLAGRCGTATRIVAIGSVNDVALFRALMALGVVDYLPKPVSSDVLSDALRRASRSESEANAPRGKARIHAFIGARGGVGVSTLALGTAWILTHEHKLNAALIDFDLHFGSLALALDLEPGRGLRQALEHPERTDSLLLAAAIAKGDERIPVLAAEESLEETLRFEPAAASAVLESLAQDYDCLILDVPRSLDGASRQALALADTIGIVTDLSLASLRDAFRLSGLVKALGARATPMFIASQVGALHRGEIGQAEFERGLGAALDFTVPFDAKAARTMAVGGKVLPVADANSKATAEMRRIAARMAGREVKARTGIRRWFG